MSVIINIRNFIAKIPCGKPFSTRDLLTIGKRASIDQALHLMVRSGRIIRLARGVFSKNDHLDGELPSTLEIAQTKAKAYGKELFTHGLEAAAALKFLPQNTSQTFATSGGSTSFACIHERVYFKCTAPKDLKHKNAPPGLMLRALKAIGRLGVTREIVFNTLASFKRLDSRAIKAAASDMPAWISDIFAPTYEHQRIPPLLEDVPDWRLMQLSGLIDESGKRIPDDKTFIDDE